MCHAPQLTPVSASVAPIAEMLEMRSSSGSRRKSAAQTAVKTGAV
jgi:hypothetical protein